MKLNYFLEQAVKSEASDLHLVSGLPPSVRVDGDIEFLPGEALAPDELSELLMGVLDPAQQSRLQQQKDLQHSFEDGQGRRYRASFYYSRGHLEASIRIIQSKQRSLEELGLPPIARELALRPSGLVLVTGATGSGKSTTMSAMVDLINTEFRSRIITIEDPIEYVHKHKRSMVIQRELDSDTPSFHEALVSALRQDPNVIVVGEMRRLETIATALTAAETGHLVISTLHTQSAPLAVDRIVDVFPAGQQEQVRVQLANCLQGVLSQMLLPRIGEKGRVLACEVLVGTASVRNSIRVGKTDQLLNQMTVSNDVGSMTMDRRLRALYEEGEISYDTAISKASDINSFRELRRV